MDKQTRNLVVIGLVLYFLWSRSSVGEATVNLTEGVTKTEGGTVWQVVNGRWVPVATIATTMPDTPLTNAL